MTFYPNGTKWLKPERYLLAEVFINHPSAQFPKVGVPLSFAKTTYAKTTYAKPHMLKMSPMSSSFMLNGQS